MGSTISAGTSRLRWKKLSESAWVRQANEPGKSPTTLKPGKDGENWSGFPRGVEEGTAVGIREQIQDGAGEENHRPGEEPNQEKWGPAGQSAVFAGLGRVRDSPSAEGTHSQTD